MFRKYLLILIALVLVASIAFEVFVYYASIGQQVQHIRGETDNRIVALENSFYWHIKNYDLFGLNSLLNVIKSDGLENLKLTFDKNEKPVNVFLGVIPLDKNESDLSCYSRQITHVGERIADIEYCISINSVKHGFATSKITYLFVASLILLLVLLSTHIPGLFYGIRLNKFLRFLSKRDGQVAVSDLKRQASSIKDKVLESILSNFITLIENEKKMTKVIADQTKMAAMGQISSHVAHDMRSPLSVLKGYVTQGLDSTGDENEEYEAAARRSVDKLLRMADELVDYSKATKIEKSHVDILKIIRDMGIEETRKKAIEKGVSVICESNFGINVHVDSQKLGRVIVNVIGNAIEAIEHDHGEVKIAVHVDENDNVIIKINDNGKGIEEKHSTHVFEPFYTWGKKGGSGLGLSYCKQVVEAHGGTIGVQSDVGKGTTFIISLPT